MAVMSTQPLGPSNSNCLSCIPYRTAVLTIAGLTMLASVVDIVFGAVGGQVYFFDCYLSSCYSYNYYVWFAWTSIAQGIFGFLMSILLFVGILKKVHGLLLSFIIGMILNAIIYFGNGAVMLTQRQRYGNNVYYGAWAMFWSVIILYFVTVVAAYRTWMMQQRAVGRIPVYSPYPVPPQGMMINPGTVSHQPMVPTVTRQIGYFQNAQPYLLPGTYQPTGTHQLQGTYLPDGTFLPHGAYLAQGTQMSPEVQSRPTGQMSPQPSFLPETGDTSKYNQ